jgi:hypothetical protein
MSHKAALINVGANVSHMPLRSPVFNDRRFEFVPIPDEPVEGLPKYAELKTFNQGIVLNFIPKRFLSLNMHNDPEFLTNTYGDSPEDVGRPSNLRRMTKGDSLYFLARLVAWNGRRWGDARFYIIGRFVVDDIVKKSDMMADRKLVETVVNNAHVKRWLARPLSEEGNFWVFVGSAESRRYSHAVPFDGDLMSRVLRKANGAPLVKPTGMTDNRFVGSNTRACRLIEDRGKLAVLEEQVRQYC